MRGLLASFRKEATVRLSQWRVVPMGNLVFLLILAGVLALTGVVVTWINREHERRLDRSRRKRGDHAGLYGGAYTDGGGADVGGGDFGGGGGDGGGGGE